MNVNECTFQACQATVVRGFAVRAPRYRASTGCRLTRTWSTQGGGAIFATRSALSLNAAWFDACTITSASLALPMTAQAVRRARQPLTARTLSTHCLARTGGWRSAHRARHVASAYRLHVHRLLGCRFRISSAFQQFCGASRAATALLHRSAKAPHGSFLTRSQAGGACGIKDPADLVTIDNCRFTTCLVAIIGESGLAVRSHLPTLAPCGTDAARFARSLEVVSTASARPST
jgi:hypothetical protein